MPRPNKGRTGRKKGVPNKFSAQAKTLVLEALAEVGGKDWLVALAREEPRAFAALVQKLVPQEIAAKVDSDFTLVLNVDRRARGQVDAPVHPAQDALGPQDGSDLDVEVHGHLPAPDAVAIDVGLVRAASQGAFSEVREDRPPDLGGAAGEVRDALTQDLGCEPDDPRVPDSWLDDSEIPPLV